MSRKRDSLDRSIRREFADTDLRWEIIDGKKHRKLSIDGHVVMVFSHGPLCEQDYRRMRSFIRRAEERRNANY